MRQITEEDYRELKRRVGTTNLLLAREMGKYFGRSTEGSFNLKFRVTPSGRGSVRGDLDH